MAAVKKNFIVAAKNGLNVREKPGKQFRVIEVLPFEAKVTINSDAETPNGWVALKGGGFVMAEFLK